MIIYNYISILIPHVIELNTWLENIGSEELSQELETISSGGRGLRIRWLLDIQKYINHCIVKEPP
jgi:hypothetical protein